MMPWLEKLLSGDANARALKKLEPIVSSINQQEEKIKKLSDEELKKQTILFRERLSKGESLDNLLPEAFATVREASKRVLGERHFDVQLMGGIVLHQGKIAEMKTGEGKTLAATLPVYLNALGGKGVHVVTVNDYLAHRDAEWMGQIYKFLGLSVGAIVHGLSPAERKEIYSRDVVYGTNNELGFDYLRDNMATRLEEVVQRELNFVIVDEVDSILIDEARTPLIISAPAEESADYYKRFAQIAPQLTAGVDFEEDEKMRAVTLTEEGVNKIEKLLGIKDIYEKGDVTLAHHIEQSIRAQRFYHRDKDYIVKDGEVVIVDEFTGRLMPGRRYSEGLHQAIEAKEGVEVKRESRTLATITFQNYFRLYNKLAGMTGTAKTEEEEFWKIYGLEVVVVPTNEPMVRRDMNDLIYRTEKAKFEAVAREIKERHSKGQPLLVGTISVEKSELLSKILQQEGIKHHVLNAKHHEQEAMIIKDAGQKGAVTISTNMAGRGTDIKLGEGVKELGGLHVIGTERHESRRIDNQLRGRSGRQGDPGSSQFFVSLEDDLMRLFGGERLKNIMKTLRVPEDQPLEHRMISRSIEQAQKKVEGHNFDIRKHVLEYDDVMNRHRAYIYKWRRQLLEGGKFEGKIWELIEEEIKGAVVLHMPPREKQLWNKKGLIEAFEPIFPISEEIKKFVEKSEDPEEIENKLKEAAKVAYAERAREAGEQWREAERLVLLRVVDMLWMEHLDAMVRLREGIGLRGYGQRDPLVEYKEEAYHMFQRLLAAIASDVTKLIFRVKIVAKPPVEEAPAEGPLIYRQPEEPKGDFEAEKEEIKKKGDASQADTEMIKKKPKADVVSAPVSEPSTVPSPVAGMTDEEIRRYAKKHNIGRNDPCPCGSGKKFKKCHGR